MPGNIYLFFVNIIHTVGKVIFFLVDLIIVFLFLQCYNDDMWSDVL